jgi:hypothetical protein
MSNFITQTSHPLIKSEQTYVLDRKLISIHSVDRDYKKWPNSNEFGIDLGENFFNVQTMRLINFAIPVNHYTFSDSYQNTKLSFTYSLNYPIYLTNFDPATDHLISFQIFKQIIKAIFGNPFNPSTFNNSAFANKSSNVIIEYWNNTTKNWKELSTSNPGDFYTTPPTPPTAPPGNIGKYRFVWTHTDTITIPEGAYSPDNLCTTIESLMNQKIYNVSSQTDLSGGTFDFLPGTTSNGPNGGQTTFTDVSSVILPSNDEDSFWNPSKGKGITPFVVHYNNVTNKVLFGCKQGSFTLNFKEKESYESKCNNGKSIFNQYTKWGLGSYLGFNKKNYSSVITDVTEDLSGSNPYQATVQQGITLPHEMPSPWLVGNAASLDISGTIGNDPLASGGWTTEVGEVLLGNTKDDDQIKNLVSTLEAEYNLDVHGEDALYMEIDKYNNIDEIYPYSERTGHMYNNDLAHRTNGSFARIPLSHLPFGQEMGSRNNFVVNIFHSDPPIQRIDRLKFRFRFHDGRLVDFKNLPFSFTLEFNMLKDEQDRVKRVRVPHLYNL